MRRSIRARGEDAIVDCIQLIGGGFVVAIDGMGFYISMGHFLRLFIIFRNDSKNHRENRVHREKKQFSYVVNFLCCT